MCIWLQWGVSYLRLSKSQCARELGPLSDRQILFLGELALQSEQLLRAERRAWLTSLLLSPQLHHRHRRITAVTWPTAPSVRYITRSPQQRQLQRELHMQNTFWDRKLPPKQLIPPLFMKLDAIILQLALSRNDKNSVEKSLDSDRDPVQHQNGMVCYEWDIPLLATFHKNSTTTSWVISNMLNFPNPQWKNPFKKFMYPDPNPDDL